MGRKGGGGGGKGRWTVELAARVWWIFRDHRGCPLDVVRGELSLQLREEMGQGKASRRGAASDPPPETPLYLCLPSMACDLSRIRLHEQALSESGTEKSFAFGHSEAPLQRTSSSSDQQRNPQQPHWSHQNGHHLCIRSRAGLLRTAGNEDLQLPSASPLPRTRKPLCA